MFPRHAIDPARDWGRLITADHKSALLLTHVNQIIRVAQTGCVMSELVPGDSFQCNVLMIYRSRWDVNAHHCSDARSPQSSRVDNDLASDRAFVCYYALNFSFG
jgi:hypothetical protein